MHLICWQIAHSILGIEDAEMVSLVILFIVLHRLYSCS